MTWTNITNAQLAIGAPVRSIDLLALRDNITAQANGDAGAPKQQTAGIADSAVTVQKMVYGYGLAASGNQLVAGLFSAEGVGSYATVWLRLNNGASANFGQNYPSGSGDGNVTSVVGTWKCMDSTGVTNDTGVSALFKILAYRIA